jgi:hypothetical protein
MATRLVVGRGQAIFIIVLPVTGMDILIPLGALWLMPTAL